LVHRDLAAFSVDAALKRISAAGVAAEQVAAARFSIFSKNIPSFSRSVTLLLGKKQTVMAFVRDAASLNEIIMAAMTSSHPEVRSRETFPANDRRESRSGFHDRGPEEGTMKQSGDTRNNSKTIAL